MRRIGRTARDRPRPATTRVSSVDNESLSFVVIALEIELAKIGLVEKSLRATTSRRIGVDNVAWSGNCDGSTKLVFLDDDAARSGWLFSGRADN